MTFTFKSLKTLMLICVYDKICQYGKYKIRMMSLSIISFMCKHSNAMIWHHCVVFIISMLSTSARKHKKKKFTSHTPNSYCFFFLFIAFIQRSLFTIEWIFNVFVYWFVRLCLALIIYKTVSLPACTIHTYQSNKCFELFMYQRNEMIYITNITML